MTTLRKIAERALRSVGAYGVGEDISAEDGEITLQAIKDICARLPQYCGGRKMVDINQAVDVTAIANRRYIASADITITLPVLPLDGDKIGIDPLSSTVTVAPNGRRVIGVTTDYTPTAPRTLIYKAEDGDWVELEGLTLNSESPYGEAFTADLRFLTAAAILDDFGASATPSLAANIQTAKQHFSAAFTRAEINNGDLPLSVRGAGVTRRYA